ncbi:MAG: bifunctional homocysteine S-methyltransferase/methylenetetrahydrofolate reductase [Kiritimatiellia bacterium]
MRSGAEFLERLGEAPIIGDGAIGSYLLELGYTPGKASEELVLTRPEAVRQVHDAYLQAGSEWIETHSFGAHPLVLESAGLAGRAADINRAAARLACQAAGARAWVAGAMGPPGLSPTDENWNEEQVREGYRIQAQSLLEGGAPLLILETFEDLDMLLLALQAVRAAAGSGIPLIAQLVFDDGGSLARGVTAGEAARRLKAAGADVIGANCGRGIQSVRRAVSGLLKEAGATPVSAFPNAGFPERIGGRLAYLSSPAYFADHAAQMVREGVRLVGGCCGTSPETIRAIRLRVAGLKRLAPQESARPPAETVPAPPTSSEGAFLEKLRSRWPLIAELDPPPHLDYAPALEGAKALSAAGADAISLADNPLASIRLDNMAFGALLRRTCDTQVIAHVTCRDRNSLGLQSALMGAHVQGIEALLAVTGDPCPRTTHGRAVSVYEMQSAGLIRLIAGLNRGVTTAGRDLRSCTRFSIGAAFNSAASSLEAELQRLRRKQAEGARFVMTQPVFDLERARRVLDLLAPTGLRVFLGFLPLVSSRLAFYLHNEVPGITIPRNLLDELAAEPDAARQEQKGLDHAAALMEQLRDRLDGIYLITPGARWKALLPLIARVNQWRQAAVPPFSASPR